MPNRAEETFLSPMQEILFQQWLQKHKDTPGVKGWDQPDAFYDIRGFFADKEALADWTPGGHSTDRYKQHGHPTFSTESKYSTGPMDGGTWYPGTEILVPAPMPSHVPTSLLQELQKRTRR